MKEIPKSQRYVGRPPLKETSKDTQGEKRMRIIPIVEAVEGWGYSQREIADHLGLHYSTVSRLAKKTSAEMSRNKT